jgi:hypothetical protein
MEYGKIKVGDVVKFNAKAKKQIASAIDEREHIVENVDVYSDGTEHVEFEDGDGASVYWLTRVRGKK